MRQRFLENGLAVILIGLLLLTAACLRTLPPRLNGEVGYQDMLIRARQQVDGKMKGGRVIVKIQADQGEMLFLSPLNQVVLKLEVNAAKATLLNPRQKTFWRGTVRQMMTELWGLPLDWQAVVALLQNGLLPTERADLGQWRILVGQGNTWSQAELSGRYGLWQFKVLKRSWSTQRLPPWQETIDWRETSLEQVVSDESPN